MMFSFDAGSRIVPQEPLESFPGSKLIYLSTPPRISKVTWSIFEANKEEALARILRKGEGSYSPIQQKWTITLNMKDSRPGYKIRIFLYFHGNKQKPLTWCRDVVQVARSETLEIGGVYNS